METWNPKNLISEDEVKKLKWHPYRLLPSGKIDIHMDTKKSRSNPTLLMNKDFGNNFFLELEMENQLEECQKN